MDEFTVKNKLWPSNVEIDLGTDSNSVTVPAVFHRHAANFVTSMDGLHNYQFLFWNTGRHITNRRHVRWNFSVGGWGLWTATRWYGTPPHNGIGNPRIHVDPFKLAANEFVGSGTAIDGPASAFPPGAYPFMGNDREIGTASGPVTVFAKDEFQSLQFAGWLRLIWGGDDSGEFVETDTGASPGSSGFYDHFTDPTTFPSGSNENLLAAYGNSSSDSIVISIKGILDKIFFPSEKIDPNKGDPAVLDRLRLDLVERLVRRADPGDPAGPDFNRLIEAAARMSKEELTRAKQSVKTSLDLGKSALAALEAQLKRLG